jgi:glycerol-3-phosphate dehydrogenase
MVKIYARDQKVVDSINLYHKNPKYLTDVILPPNLSAINKFDQETADKFDVS